MKGDFKERNEYKTRNSFMKELLEIQRDKKEKEKLKFNLKECIKAYNLAPSQKSFLKKYLNKTK